MQQLAPRKPRTTPSLAPEIQVDRPHALILALILHLKEKGKLRKYRDWYHFTVDELEQVALVVVCRMENILGLKTDIPSGGIRLVIVETASKGCVSCILAERGEEEYEIQLGFCKRVEAKLQEKFTPEELVIIAECVETACAATVKHRA